MRLNIVGIEGSSGIGAKSGEAYEIGQLHSMARIAAPLKSTNIARGVMGTTYRCPLALIKALAGHPLPFMAEVEVEDVMRFGKREQEVISINPEKQPVTK